MSKTSTLTHITPLPAGITRQAAVAFLQDHLAMIDLNPLVIDRQRIPPPDHALPEERACTWYLVTDKISYLPGGLAKGSVSYSSAFLDLAGVGLQTHCYAPMGVDIRSKWMVCGSTEDEGLPPEVPELGLETPTQGLYLREETEVRCSVVMGRFVKKTLKDAHVRLADKLVARGAREAREARERKQYLGTPASSSSSTTTATTTTTAAAAGGGLQVPGNHGGFSRDSKQRPLSWAASPTEETFSTTHKGYYAPPPPPPAVDYSRNANQHYHNYQHQHQQQQQHDGKFGYQPHSVPSGGVSNGMYELGGGEVLHHNSNDHHYASQHHQHQHHQQGHPQPPPAYQQYPSGQVELP